MRVDNIADKTRLTFCNVIVICKISVILLPQMFWRGSSDKSLSSLQHIFFLSRLVFLFPKSWNWTNPRSILIFIGWSNNNISRKLRQMLFTFPENDGCYRNFHYETDIARRTTANFDDSNNMARIVPNDKTNVIGDWRFGHTLLRGNLMQRTNWDNRITSFAVTELRWVIQFLCAFRSNRNLREFWSLPIFTFVREYSVWFNLEILFDL